MASNGRLPGSALRRIYHPKYAVSLENSVAGAWEAMRAEAKRRRMVAPYPLGPNSAYRTYASQQYFRNYWCNRGKCGNAARPGTSNHGWGKAVDLADGGRSMRNTVRAIGGKYGWYWGEVPWESWHVTYRGGYRPSPKPSPYRLLRDDERSHLRLLFYHRRGMIKEGKSGKGAKYRAHLKHARDHKWWLNRRRKRLVNFGRKEGWAKHNRGARYQILTKAVKNSRQIH